MTTKRTQTGSPLADAILAGGLGYDITGTPAPVGPRQPGSLVGLVTPGTAMERVKRLRGQLLLDYPFFGALSLKLQLVEDPSCKTAWTDGVRMGFNPAYLATLDDEEVLFVIAHETMHPALGHNWRRDGREPLDWNKSADYPINSILKAAGFKLPANVLYDAQWDGQNAEFIFSRIAGQTPDPKGDEQQDQPEPDAEGDEEQDGGSEGGDEGEGDEEGAGAGDDASGDESGEGDEGQDGDGDEGADGQQGEGDGTPEPGDVRDAPADATAEEGTDEASWQQAVRQAAQLGRGTMPGSLRAAIEEAGHVAIDWASLLMRFATEVAAADYSWTRPNPRYIASGLYLPALRSEDCGPIVFAIDTSGSMDEVLLQQVVGQLADVTNQVKPREVHVVHVDTTVQHVDVFQRGERVTVDQTYGGGGTDLRPVFDYVEQEQIAPAALVYFTDLDGTMPTSEPGYPVLWLACGSGRKDTAPWGETVPCE